MLKSFKSLKKSLDKSGKNATLEKDCDGRVVINMKVRNDDDFLSPLSSYDNPVLSDTVTDFLDTATKGIKATERLCLRVKSDCIDDTEKVLYTKAIKETYAEEYLANERELKRNSVFSLLLALCGILVLVALVIFESAIGNAVWGEIIDILAWVLLWESFDLYIFRSRELKLKRLRCLSLVSMKVEYSDDSKN